MGKVYVYPADKWACGHYRMTWPAEAVLAQGGDITVVEAGQRDFTASLIRNKVHSVKVADDTEAIVIQRPTHRLLAESVSVLRKQGIAVIVDMDDDLSCIHPNNVAHTTMHPREGDPSHSWLHAKQACADATFVTTSTPALLERYAKHGRGMVLPNFVPKRFLDIAHEDHDEITWCGSLHSHPDDLSVLGGSISSLVSRGAQFRTIGGNPDVNEVLGTRGMPATGPMPLEDWPAAVSSSGITIAPLTNTKFNEAKSWLKPLEAMALGVPVVMSPRREYTRLHEMTGTGMLADKPRQWESMLRRYITDPDLREEHSKLGREYVAEHLTIERNAWRWREAWNVAVELQNGRISA